ncbi:hypothetical protein AVEN_199281-1 [Araneus ventricosus]|uniref:DUF5641 domain-containing protein n=1 Tax=Araneus ventricosus TaxID=182803 RepID=A0A4Y2LS81_ARAVE|nr:hypothetical protein AVEN_199281-1 [Araneus ventricosus]
MMMFFSGLAEGGCMVEEADPMQEIRQGQSSYLSPLVFTENSTHQSLDPFWMVRLKKGNTPSIMTLPRKRDSNWNAGNWGCPWDAEPLLVTERSGTLEDEVAEIECSEIPRRKLCQDLRKRLRIEYLGHLREFSKICNESKIKEGYIVLIGDSNVKIINWPLGRVIKLYLGKDKKVRLVEIQTKSGSFLLPIQRLFSLEISQSETSAVPRPPKSDPLSKMIPDGVPTSSDSIAVPDVNPNVNVCSRRRSRYGRLLKPSALLDSFI